jgi:Flp pilus assembly protein TadD
MSTRRLVASLAALVVIELSFFYVQHHDVVRLSQARETLIADAQFPETAMAVLARERVSRRVLERVADVAGERQEFALKVRALERIVSTVPADAEARLRLAQALRDAGRLEDAERLYRAELGLGANGDQR